MHYIPSSRGVLMKRVRSMCCALALLGLILCNRASAANETESTAAIEPNKAEVSAEHLDALPFSRYVDVEYTTVFRSQFPSLLTITVEGHPWKGLGIAAYGGYYFPGWDAAFITGLDLSYRWNVLLERISSTGSVHELNLGPTAGMMIYFKQL